MAKTSIVNEFVPGDYPAQMAPNAATNGAAAGAPWLGGWMDCAGAFRITYDGKLQRSATAFSEEPWFVRRPTANDSDKILNGTNEATFTAPGVGIDFMVLGRVDEASKHCYAARFISGNLYICRFSGDAFIGNLASAALTLVEGTTYRMFLRFNGTSPTSLSAWVTTEADPNTPLSGVTVTASDSTANVQVANTGGIGTYNANAYGGDVTRIRRYLNATAFDAGWASATCGASSIALECVGPWAGSSTAPYSYQWERSSTGFNSGFADLSGLTSRTGTDSTAASGTDYWYRLKVTDSAGSPATVYSNVIGPLRITPTEKFILIGDSLFARDASEGDKAAGAMVDVLADACQDLFEDRDFTFYSNSTGGLKWSDYASPGGSRYASTVTMIQSNSITKAVIQLGNNDCRASVSASTLSGQIDNVLAWLAAEGVTEIYLNYPIWWMPQAYIGTTEAQADLMREYFAVIDSKINGSTVKAGTRHESQLTFARFPNRLDGQGLHPQDRAFTMEAYRTARALYLGKVRRPHVPR